MSKRKELYTIIWTQPYSLKKEVKMNPHDKSNLDFLMNINIDSFNEWASQASEDDIAYALELIRQARAALEVDLVEILDDVEDFSEAKSVLQKFMLNK